LREVQTSLSSRLAIFGGSFDPPHLAHQHCLNEIAQQYQFDHIYVIPSKFPPGKSPVADYATRLQWARKCFFQHNIEVLDFEGPQNQTVFAADIVKNIAGEFPNAEITWILGQDQWKQLSYWKDIDSYAMDVHWLVMPRSEESVDDSGVLSRRLLGSTCSYHWAKVSRYPALSSSEVRDHCRKNQKDSVKAVVPPEILSEVITYYQTAKQGGSN